MAHSDQEECYYLSPTMNGKTQYGTVGVPWQTTCKELSKSTNSPAVTRKRTSMKHLRTTRAHVEPVFLAYHPRPTLHALRCKYAATQPVYDFIAPIDGFRHQLWLVTDATDQATITAEFEAMDSLYIADGHHRSAAAALVGDEMARNQESMTGNEEFNYYMAVCSPSDELTILDYNRVVKDLNGLSPEAFLQALEKNFTVEAKGNTPYRPSHPPRVFALPRWHLVCPRSASGHVRCEQPHRCPRCRHFFSSHPRRTPSHQGFAQGQAHSFCRRTLEVWKNYNAAWTLAK